jgi:hypothetical protein
MERSDDEGRTWVTREDGGRDHISQKETSTLTWEGNIILNQMSEVK